MDTLDSRYSQFGTLLQEAAEEHLSPDQGSHAKRKERLTDEILEAVEKKAAAFLAWNNCRGTLDERKARSKYVLLRRSAKKLTDQRQMTYWDEISAEIEAAIKQHDPATAYSMIRRLRGGIQRVENMPIQDKNGKPLLNSSDRLERWKEYFNDLLNVRSVVDQALIDQIQSTSISDQERRRQEKPPTLAEVQQAVNQSKRGKAPGNDNITTDLLKAGGATVVRWMHEFFTEI
jgi:hypothetical protein